MTITKLKEKLFNDKVWLEEMRDESISIFMQIVIDNKIKYIENILSFIEKDE